MIIFVDKDIIAEMALNEHSFLLKLDFILPNLKLIRLPKYYALYGHYHQQLHILAVVKDE